MLRAIVSTRCCSIDRPCGAPHRGLLDVDQIPLVEQLDEQRLLGLEVVQQTGRGVVRAVATSDQRRLVEPLLPEGHQRGVEDLLPTDPGASCIHPFGLGPGQPGRFGLGLGLGLLARSR